VPGLLCQPVNRTRIILSLVALALAIVAGSLWLDRYHDHTPDLSVPSPDEQQMARVALDAFTPLAVTTIDPRRASDQIAALLAPRIPAPPLEPGPHRVPMPPREIDLASSRLPALLTQILAQRVFVDESVPAHQRASDYARWRASRSDALIEIANDDTQHAMLHEMIAGQTPDENLTNPQRFAALIERADTQRDAYNTAVALTPGPGGVLMELWWHHPHTSPRNPTVAHPLGADAWANNFASGSFPWFTHARTSPDLAGGMKPQLHAYAGVIVEYADGHRRPLVLKARWEPLTQHWVIDHIIHAHADRSSFQMLVY
jgi:hypothetical protein